jgi:hypothetical protein
VALLIAPAPAANAAVTCGKSVDGSIVYPTPFLSTGYGPVSHGTQSNNQGFAQPGFYSPVTRGFSATAAFLRIKDENAFVASKQPSSDNVFALVCGFRVLSTAYGPAIYGIQYLNGQGRWGNYNLSARMFYPDGSGWSPIAQ